MRTHSPALSEHVPFLVYIYYFGPVNFHYRYLCLNRCNFLVFWTTEFTVIMCERMQIFGILDQWIYSTYVWKYATFLYFGPLNLQYLCMSERMKFFGILDQWIYSTFVWPYAFFFVFWTSEFTVPMVCLNGCIFFWILDWTSEFTVPMSDRIQFFLYIGPVNLQYHLQHLCLNGCKFFLDFGPVNLQYLSNCIYIIFIIYVSVHCFQMWMYCTRISFY